MNILWLQRRFLLVLNLLLRVSFTQVILMKLVYILHWLVIVNIRSCSNIGSLLFIKTVVLVSLWIIKLFTLIVQGTNIPGLRWNRVSMLHILTLTFTAATHSV